MFARMATRSAFRTGSTSPKLLGSRVVPKRPARPALLARSTENEDPIQQPNGTYFFKGKSYSAEEWKEAINSGALANESFVADSQKVKAAPNFTELMKFDGVVPERNNGRLAMIAVIAAIAAELASGKSVFNQIAVEPTLISLTFILISAASFIPFSRNVDPQESEGIFTPKAEIINGRAAMLGFAALLVIEGAKGGALFG